jgi:hypothetical protein
MKHELSAHHRIDRRHRRATPRHRPTPEHDLQLAEGRVFRGVREPRHAQGHVRGLEHAARGRAMRLHVHQRPLAAAECGFRSKLVEQAIDAALHRVALLDGRRRGA